MICILYQLRSERTPRSITLAPKDYFDPIDPSENGKQEVIPRFDHAYQYTQHSPDELKWTVLLGGPIDGSVIRTQFLNGRRSMMTHRADADGYEEIIHSTAIGEDGMLTLRTVKKPGQAWAVLLSNYSVKDSIGESNHTGWSWDEMHAFCGVGIGAEPNTSPETGRI